MAAIKRIKKGDTVKVISGDNKGTTAKVLAVLTAKNAVLLEGIGQKHRHISQANSTHAVEARIFMFQPHFQRLHWLLMKNLAKQVVSDTLKMLKVEALVLPAKLIVRRLSNG